MSQNGIKLFVNGVGICGTGLPNWDTAQAVFTQAQAFQADAPELGPVSELPPAERRRVGTLVKLSFAAGREALQHAQERGEQLPSVFTSSSGDGDNCNELFATLAGVDRQISPTRFHNSVHNAAAGYWSIAQSSMASSTSLCAHDGSFCAGLLEAVGLTQALQRPALLVSYDCPYPEPLSAARPVQGTMGIAMVLAQLAGPQTRFALRLELVNGMDQAPTRLGQSGLEALRQHNPTGRALPLLDLLAQAYTPAKDSVTLAYLPGCQLRLTRLPLPSAT